MYLVLAPYVASAINYAITGFDFVHDLQLEEVARMRLQTILDMKEAELIAYSNNQTDAISGDLAFSSVSYNGADNDCGKLSSFSLRIVPKSIVLFCGARGSGKRAIFYLLRRVIVPTAGTITMDDINILDFEKDTYKHNLSYTTSNPYFYSESIMDNLLYVCPSKTKIRAVCASLGIEDLIRALPDKYETNLLRQSADISDYLKFMIGLARAVLLDAEFVCIYEFPNSLTGQEKALVKSAIKKISARRAIIIFSAGNFAADICDSIFIVSGGKVSEATSPQNGRAKTTGAVVLASSGRATTKVSGASTTMANTSRTKKQTSRYGRKKVSVAPGGEPWA
jgi:ATP-binding cassette subfamily B protein